MNIPQHGFRQNLKKYVVGTFAKMKQQHSYLFQFILKYALQTYLINNIKSFSI